MSACGSGISAASPSSRAPPRSVRSCGKICAGSRAGRRAATRLGRGDLLLRQEQPHTAAIEERQLSRGEEVPQSQYIAIETLDAVVRHIAGAAEDLHGAVRDAADHFGSEELRAGRQHRDILAGVTAAKYLYWF